MMNIARKLLILVILSTAAIGLTSAQSTATNSSSTEASSRALSTVTGRVFDADTNVPLRRASVNLYPVDEILKFDIKKRTDPTSKTEDVDTLLDGSFIVNNVPPGEYFVLAQQKGYEIPMAAYFIQQRRNELMDEETKRKLLAGLPRVSVQPGQNAHANISIKRGGNITGQILYDDGTPASGLHVSIMVRNAKNEWKVLPSYFSKITSASDQTNDEGRYRITGLPAGEYILRVDIAVFSFEHKAVGNNNYITYAQMLYDLILYSGNKIRSSEATSFKINAGETRTGEDIEIPLNKMHTIKGNLTSAHDGHSINNGELSLLFADDKTELSKASISRTSNGFQFFFVPEGDYILRVNSAKDADYKEIPTKETLAPARWEAVTLKEYGTVEQPILITNEQSDLNIAVPEAKKSAAKQVTAQ